MRSCEDHDDCQDLDIVCAEADPEQEGHVLCPECETSVEDWPWACGLLSCDACGHEWLCDCCVETGELMEGAS
jgi:hypothetical protein